MLSSKRMFLLARSKNCLPFHHQGKREARRVAWVSSSAATSPAKDLNVGDKISSSAGSNGAPASGTKSQGGGSSFKTARNLALFGSGVALGSLIGSQYTGNAPQEQLKYPSGMPRMCDCEEEEDSGTHVSLKNLTENQKNLAQKLQKIVGDENVLDGSVQSTATSSFLKGQRLGKGQALCIVTPRRVKDVYEILQPILEANCVILPQGQNTGLTGGSVPRQDSSDDRPVVLLSMKNLDTIAPVDNGERVLCLAGAGLASLDRFLVEHFPNREPHSQLGSTFLNPTTAAGIAFGSGGSQCIRKGPAFTERALYLKISQNKWKENVVEIVNTLGIKKLSDSPAIVGQESKFNNAVYKLDAYTESIKRGFKQNQCFSDKSSRQGSAPAHDPTYKEDLCKHDSKVSRFNADTKGQDCNRSEGKVIILATVHDTFPKPEKKRSFWVGFESLDLALEFREKVLLDNPVDLPLTSEYMDRDSLDVIDQAGRVMANVIQSAGTTSPSVKKLWDAKTYIESLPFASAHTLIDKLLFKINNIFPSVLSNDVLKICETMDHHIAMSVGDFGDGGMDRLLERLEAFAAKHGSEKVAVHECVDPKEAASLGAFRFVAAPAFRTWCVGNGVQGFSVDYALPKNGGAAPPLASDDKHPEKKPLKRMRYSHFGCNVVHEDLAFGPGVDLDVAKYDLKKTVEKKCGGKLPAEHGHGTEYDAPPDTQKRWKKMDPLNVLNPGVGGLSTKRAYAAEK